MSLSAVLAEGAEQARELPVPSWVYGASALVVFLVLIFVVTRFDPDR